MNYQSLKVLNILGENSTTFHAILCQPHKIRWTHQALKYLDPSTTKELGIFNVQMTEVRHDSFASLWS